MNVVSNIIINVVKSSRLLEYTVRYLSGTYTGIKIPLHVSCKLYTIMCNFV